MTPRQSAFVGEFLVDLNATQAAIRAGYSQQTAEWTGPRLLHQPAVAQAIAEAMQARSERTGITADRVLQEYARIAFFDARRFFSESGALVPIDALDADTAAVVAGLDVVRTPGPEGAPSETVKIRLANKLGALDSLARHLGMFLGKDSLDLSLGEALAERLSRARQREKT